MTPARSIRLECRWCSNCKSVDCISKVCKLKDVSLSHLKRIRAHCLDCVETRQEVKECTGKLLYEDRLCYLHPYRFGKNPNRKPSVNTSHLDRFKFSKKHAVIA